MKLVAAKCPNCGAEIEVDKNSDSTRCDYCNSKIIVEEAVERLRLEVSNLPKCDNFIVLGDRCYKDKKYKEASDYYGKALELDPNNYYAILREGFSKTMNSKFYNLDVSSSIRAFKNAEKELKDKNSEEYRKAILLCNNVIKKAETNILQYYKNIGIKREEVEYFNSKLQECLNGYEYLYSVAEDDEMKKGLLNNIIHEIDNIIMTKTYLTGPSLQSRKEYYHMDDKNVSIFKNAREKYLGILNKIKNPEFVEQTDKRCRK